MDKTKKYDILDSKRKFDKSKLWAKILSELITQAMDGTSVANRYNHRVLLVE